MKSKAKEVKDAPKRGEIVGRNWLSVSTAPEGPQRRTEGVPSFRLCASLFCLFQKVERRACTTF